MQKKRTPGKPRRYYAVFDGQDYLQSGLNCQYKSEVKSEILSLVESETEENTFKKMSLSRILSVKGWRLDKSTERFFNQTLD